MTDEPPTPIPAALDGRLGFLLGQAHLLHRRVAEAQLSPLGLRGKEFGALAILVDEGAMSQQRLGARMGVDRTTMVAVVDALQRGGLVARDRDPRDRRAYALRATAHGAQVLARATEAVDRAEEAFLARLAPEDRRAFRRLLREIVEG